MYEVKTRTKVSIFFSEKTKPESSETQIKMQHKTKNSWNSKPTLVTMVTAGTLAVPAIYFRLYILVAVLQPSGVDGGSDDNPFDLVAVSVVPSFVLVFSSVVRVVSSLLVLVVVVVDGVLDSVRDFPFRQLELCHRSGRRTTLPLRLR